MATYNIMRYTGRDLWLTDILDAVMLLLIALKDTEVIN